MHEIFVNGYRGLSYIDSDGIEQNPTIRVVSHLVEENEFLAVNQVTVRSKDVERRFDIVLYAQRLAGRDRRTQEGRRQEGRPAPQRTPSSRRTCANSLWRSASACSTIISDGITARYGTPFTPLNHYSPWNVDDDGRPSKFGTDPDDERLGTELEYLIDGLFNPERFLQLLRNFAAFDAGADGY